MNAKSRGRSRGNVKAQRERQERRRSANVKPVKEAVDLIDGNRSKFVIAYCDYYEAYLTLGLIETHRCNKRSCNRLVMITDGQVDN